MIFFLRFIFAVVMAESRTLRDTPERYFRSAKRFFDRMLELRRANGTYLFNEICRRLNAEPRDTFPLYNTRDDICDSINFKYAHEIVHLMTHSEWKEKEELLDEERYIKLFVDLYSNYQYPEAHMIWQNVITLVTLIKEMT